MKNRASSHLLLLLLILGLEITGYLAVHRAALLRGYETSTIGAVRDLLMFVPLVFLALWLSRSMRFVGNWVLFTTAILLFSFGMLILPLLVWNWNLSSPAGQPRRDRNLIALLRVFVTQERIELNPRHVGLGDVCDMATGTFGN